MTIAEVKLWGKSIGAVAWDEDNRLGHFEYEKSFVNSGIELAPLTMPLSPRIYSFPGLPWQTFRGLPGMLADSLPDDFGNLLIDAWLAKQGRSSASFNPVERLCYIGTRGMGALEFHPSQDKKQSSDPLDIAALTELAGKVLKHRESLSASFSAEAEDHSLQEILKVGTSAGGARAKAIIAWNRETNEVRSGQAEQGEGFSQWIIKFDGVQGNRDRELDDPKGYGLIEYAYYKMALAAGIEMMESQIYQENHRNHFLTRRFDRTDSGLKIHMQTYAAIAHLDYQRAGAYSYEQLFQTLRLLRMPMSSIEQQFRRMAFNVLARNQDDHVKNISFLMDGGGNWSLSPAYDLAFSYNPHGLWTGSHQMTINGKRDKFELSDFRECAMGCSMKKGRAEEIIAEVAAAVGMWAEYAEDAGVRNDIARYIGATHRLPKR